ncbi:hypothetical protein BLJ79_21490 [Arthrobacter sp. UCD-GKA]|uniref:hypothetical protein n=1 Tax=Arthrobacter sp. UCD-GKA TaxID=1913576 RepID=UPI0008DCF3F8|nr:hypothetical protein [Arthrobacter sp. UCD-GKA]OIH81936.1 hypothetical protein BLJ79_21490 [Arthrobacter sp. UCD-GKA]
MSDYTPSIDRLRNAYVDRIDFEAQMIGVERPSDEQSFAEFDRAIAQIKADVWQEGCDEFERAHNMSNYEPWEYAQDNPYRTP